jgi:YHS domain-containing protein
MEKSRRLWVLGLVFLLGGCAGEDSGAPPASGPAASVPAKPDMNKVTASGGGMAAESAPPAGKGDTNAPAAPKDESQKTDAPFLEGPKTDASHEDARSVKLTDAEIAKIRTLPAAEQDAALTQAVCPVSGKHLGSMGTPFKITAEGHTFYLCCDGCEDEVQKDPKAVVAKLDEK